MSTPAAGPTSRLEQPCAGGEFTPCVARAVRSLLNAVRGDGAPDRRDTHFTASGHHVARHFDTRGAEA